MADFPIKKDEIINGGVNSYVYPQHEKSDGSFVITGEKNPLPVADYGMTSGGVWIPQRVSDDGAAHTQFTGSNVEYVFNDKVQSQQTNNLYIGEIAVSGNHAIGFDISAYREIAFYIGNNTERTVKISSVRFGGVRSAGSDEFYRTDFGGGEIVSGSSVYLSKVNEGLSTYSNYFDVKAPYFVIHLFRVGSEPMSEGDFDIKVVGIK